MASNLLKVASELEAVKVERDYWKESYKILESKYQQLVSCHTCVEEYAQPAKRARLEEEDDKSMDPLKLPEPCVRSILSYLSGKEILKMMEVSKSWKQNIESRKSVMNRALDEVIVKPTVKDFSHSMFNRFMYSPMQRGYKHMESSLTLQFKIKKYIHPVEAHTSTLESLTIYDDCDFDSSLKPSIFPVLRKLNMESMPVSFYLDCSFPMLTHLKIRYADKDQTLEELKKFFANCPKLETCHLEDEIGYSEDDNAASTNQSKLQNLHMYNICEYFLQDFQNSLVKLEIRFVNQEDYYWLIQHLKVLKSLSISYIKMYRDEEVDFRQNESIEVFKVGEIRSSEENENQFQEIMLSALPSLRELVVVDGLTVGIIQFLASNMLHLEKLTCKEINEQLRLAHEEIQNNPHQHVNSTFDLIADPDYDIFEIKNEFT